MRLDLALVRRHPGLSRRRARAAIEKGQVSLDGHTVREPGQAVADPARVAWDPHRKALSRARCSLGLLYHDEHLLAVDKPAGLLTVPSSPAARSEDTALARVREYVRRLSPRRPYVGLVHRIDRDTSGAVAFALTPQAREHLRRLFREHRIERRYLALVQGRPRADAGTVDAPIGEAYVAGRRRVARAGEAARPATTRWRVRELFAGAALLEIELTTGRQHQIRVHLAHVGLPILGDAVYGKQRGAPPARAPRQMLHAAYLGFVHPETGEPVRAQSPLPRDFAEVLSELRRRES